MAMTLRKRLVKVIARWRCPEHGEYCDGENCCCDDLHRRLLWRR